jgi:hypothetical protein
MCSPSTVARGGIKLTLALETPATLDKAAWTRATQCWQVMPETVKVWFMVFTQLF